MIALLLEEYEYWKIKEQEDLLQCLLVDYQEKEENIKIYAIH